MKQLMRGHCRPKYRLSPNEVERLKKEETERRRKLRIIQVRERANAAAAKIRNDVKEEKNRQLIKLAQEIESQLQKEKQEEVKRLEQQYENTLRSIGQGHSQAIITDKNISHAEQRLAAEEKKQRAEIRFKQALRNMTVDKAYKEYEENRHIRDRQAALLEEKKRSAEVAARPPPPADPLASTILDRQKFRRSIPLTDMNAFSTTHYHMPVFAVQKALPEQQSDGKAAGDEEDIRTKEEVAERQKKEHDQWVKARIRGNEALKKEKLKHVYDSLMADLSLQQRADRRQRQLVVSKLPKQVFLPPDRRMEELDDMQMEMERAFEDMYMKQMNLSGDLSLTLDANPVPSTPTEDEGNSQDTTEESPVVVLSMPPVNPALKELTNIAHMQETTSVQDKPETVLKKLMHRIKEQRNEAEAEKRQAVEISFDNPGSNSVKNKVATVGPNFMKASKPTVDPVLDLSPLQAPSNQKPDKIPAVQQENGLQEEVDVTSQTADSEEDFLDELKGRLQAIEIQKDYLDQKMKEQQKQHLPLSKISDSGEPLTSSQSFAMHAPSIPAESLQTRPQVSGDQHFSWNWLQQHAEDPVRATVPRVEKTDSCGNVFSVHSALHISRQKQDCGTNTMETSQGLAGFGTNHQAIQPVMGCINPSTLNLPQYVSQFQTFLPGRSWCMTACDEPSFAAHGVGVYREVSGMRELSDVCSVPSTNLYPTNSGSLPAVSFPILSSLCIDSDHNTQSSEHLPLSSSFHTSSVTSHPSFPASLPAFQQTETRSADSGIQYPALFPSRLNQNQLHSFKSGPLSSSLTSSLNEQRLRDYQRQIIDKHHERVTFLQSIRTRIEKSQADSAKHSSSSLLSATHSIADPASLVPYTLKTSFELPKSSAIDSGPLSSQPSARGSAPLYTSFGSSAQTYSSATGPAFLGLAKPLSARVTNSLSTSCVQSTFSTLEPVLAGSTGITMTVDQKQVPVQEVRLSALSDFGDKKHPIGRVNTTSKLDSVRKSLPFDNPDDTLQLEAVGVEVGDNISLANDSCVSSSTERGSPALGSNNKAATSEKIGSGLSLNDSVSNASLMLRAKEQRMNFERRQQELQDQLVKIQSQEATPFSDYVSQMSTQEEDLRFKLRSVHVSTKSSADFDMTQTSSAVSLGIYQSGSPSLELEEKTISSENLSRSRNWAMELDEYSAENENGEKMFVSPGNMTLEEFSITTDMNSGERKDKSISQTRPVSSLSSLEEYSIISSNDKCPADAQVDASQVNTFQDTSVSMRMRLDIRDLQELKGKCGELSEYSASTQSPVEQDVITTQSLRLPPPPTRQPVAITEYEPHELSTILEVDTPQTGAKTIASKVLLAASEATEADKPAFCRYIDFNRQGSVLLGIKDSKISASDSSCRPVVLSNVNVQPSGLHALGTGEGDTLISSRREESIPGLTAMQAATSWQASGSRSYYFKPETSKDVSTLSSSQGFQSLALTVDSHTTGSLSMEDFESPCYKFINSGEANQGLKKAEQADSILKQARQFNQEVMANFRQQSADIFDQSSLSSFSHTMAESSNTSLF